MTSESQERMLAIVTPDDLDRVDEVCRRWEVRAAWSAGSPTARAAGPAADPRRVRTATVLADVPAAALTTTRPLPPAHGPPGDHEARAGRRPGALPPPATAAPTCWPCWPTRRGSTASTTTSSSSTRSVARAATPPAPGGAGPAPARAGPWPCPPTPTPLVPARPRAGHGPDRGRVGPQRGLRRGAAHGRGQLPQFRQPRAPRGHVAAVGGDRRDDRGVPGPRPSGDRRQRQPLQREPGSTSTRPRSSARSA